jgi:[ribosomal protein S5]-alanine N-acetyltransferase
LNTVTYYLKGKRFSLSGLREKDLAEDAPYFAWMNELGYDLHTERSRFPNHMSRHRAYYERSGQGRDLVLLGIYDNSSGRHIGNASFKDINWHSQRGHLGYIVGDPEFHGRGAATEAVLMFMLYGFQKLNFHRVFTTISADNTPSRRVAEKVGLVEEGLMRQHIYTAGRRLDVVQYGTLRDEWMKAKGGAARACFDDAPF